MKKYKEKDEKLNKEIKKHLQKVLYNHNHNLDYDYNERTNTFLYKFISLTLYSRCFCGVWEMSGDRDRLLYWPKFFSWP